MACSLSSLPRATFYRWRGGSTAGRGEAEGGEKFLGGGCAWPTTAGVFDKKILRTRVRESLVMQR
jgi:hypothetical protein